MKTDLYRSLDFPLNVYAHALQLENGDVHSLHYGLWSEEANDLTSAQKAATELLWEHLPAPPARLLEVGIGLGSTAGALIDAGYDYTGVVPDAGQIAVCREVLAPREPRFLHQRFEDTEGEEELDLILFQESAQYIAPAELIAVSRRLLAPGGTVLIFDEVSASVSRTLARSLFSSGLNLEDQLDVTDRAAPSVRYLHQTIDRHRQQILEDLDVSESLLDGFQNVLRKREMDYREGRYSYQMIRLRKSA